VHIYRIVGSAQAAETLLAAWRGRDQFQGRASVRVWLYRMRRTVPSMPCGRPGAAPRSCNG
jgi:RNA polymerase sigma-70 factor (ECF subfamily)